MYDELIKAIRQNTCHFGACGMCPKRNVLCLDRIALQAADAIEELILRLNHADEQIERLVEENEKRRWVSVTERLPKADEYDARGYAVPYLVMNGWMRVTARRTKDYWVLFGNGTVLEYVTHWMPLPEPPEEET